MILQYKRTEKGTIWVTVPGDVPDLRIAANNIRQEKTGEHAKITLAQGSAILAYDTFNIGRSEDRGRLSNAAYAMMGEAERLAIKKDEMRHALDVFCDGLWAEHIGAQEAELTYGNPDATATKMAFAPYVVDGGGTILFGPPGGGKSWTTLLMAVSADSGSEVLWDVPRPRRALFINLERPKKTLEARLARINQFLGLEVGRPLLMMHARGKSWRDIEDAVRESVAKHKVEIIFLDSLSRMGLGDLNENRTGNDSINALNGVGCSWVAIGHVGRQDSSHVYGSIMQDAGGDVMLMLASQRLPSGTIGVRLEVTKANDIPWPEARILALEFDSKGLSNVREAVDWEFSELGRGVEDDKKERLLVYVKERGEVSVQEAVTFLNCKRPYAQKLLGDKTQYAVVRNDGRSLVYSAL